MQKRFSELAARADTRGIWEYTDFLNLQEQAQLARILPSLRYAGVSLEGGAALAERKIACFGSEEACGYPSAVPIAYLEIRPKQPKFAEALAHRDVLGALLHLGVGREKIGDIFLSEGAAYVLVKEELAAFFCDELRTVRHTVVQCRQIAALPETCAPKTEERHLTAASDRVDAVLAGVFHLSREESSALIAAGKVAVDGAELQNRSRTLKKGELVSVRGHGRFRYLGTGGETAKGRLRITVERFIS